MPEGVIMKNSTGKLFTIGHSTHTAPDFINLLRLNGCQTVCDVRSLPYSRYSGQFDREKIAAVLSSEGLKYLFLGKELGGRSADLSHYNKEGKLQYSLLSESAVFQKGLEMIIKEASAQNTALMCSEKDPLQCHRMILICRALCKKRAFPEDYTYHILSDGSIKTNKEMEQILLRISGLTPDLFRTEEDCIKEAYLRQAEKIAYSKNKRKKRARITYKADSSEQTGLF